MKSGVAETVTAVTAAKKTAPDRSKRDEWSEGGVMSLLDEYEAKWILRNRAKLKANDWDEIARRVSVRDGAAKSAKSASQCKNKIESLKKRYRSESSVAQNNGFASGSAHASQWQFYDRIDSLVKGTVTNFSKSKLDGDVVANVDLDSDRKIENHVGEAQVGGGDGIEVEEGENHILGSNHDDEPNPNSNLNPTLSPNPNMFADDSDSSSSTPKRKMGNAGFESGNMNGFKRRRRFGNGVGESIRLLAHSMMKIEQGWIEMYKESERLRMDAEVRRAELEVRQTEIIAKTQLQIAKLFAKRLSSQRDGTESSSFRGEVVTNVEAEQKNG